MEHVCAGKELWLCFYTHTASVGNCLEIREHIISEFWLHDLGQIEKHSYVTHCPKYLMLNDANIITLVIECWFANFGASLVKSERGGQRDT